MSNELIIGIREHRILGPIFTGYLIEPEQSFYKVIDTISMANINTLSPLPDEEITKVIKLIDEYNDQSLLRLFSRQKKKKISAQDFLGNLEKEFLESHIRPYIDRRLQKCIDILKDQPYRVFNKKETIDTLHPEDEIRFHLNYGEVVFNFTRTNNGIDYFLSILHKGQHQKLMGKHFSILSIDPAIVLIENEIFHFKDIDAKKLKPFFTKKSIQVPKSAEKKYFESFVFNSIKKFRVNATGFEILDETPQKKAVLSLEKDWKEETVLLLQFHYNKKHFLANNPNKITVKINNPDGHYIFHKLTRDFNWEKNRIEVLETMGLKIEQGSNFKIDKKEQDAENLQLSFINWLNDHEQELKEQGFEIAQNFFKKKYFTQKIELNFSMEKKRDWFDVHAFIQFGEFKIPFIRLRRNIIRGDREFKLPNGEFAIIPEEWFEKFQDLFLFSEDYHNSLRLDQHHFQLINKLGEGIDQSYKEEFEKLLDHEIKTVLEKPKGLKAELRPYQQIGYSWLNNLEEFSFGGCLADDMGLGKTLQTISLLYRKLNQGKNTDLIESTEAKANTGTQLSLFDAVTPQQTKKESKSLPSLIVMPKSLIHNWENEIKKFAPKLKTLIYTGSKREKVVSKFYKVDIIMTTYGTVRNDYEPLSHYLFYYIILDESQNIKNPNSKAYIAINALKAKNKLVLTGTPIENSLIDLWAQMNFINKGLLGDLKFFKNNFAVPIEKAGDLEKQEKLKQLIQPFILRRTKKAVAKDLPDLTEQVVDCDMDEEQEKLYTSEKSKIRNAIIEGMEKEGKTNLKLQVLAGLTKLRQIANHPVLVEDEYSDESGKFREITDRMESLQAENHKVLVFSSFVKHLDLFAEFFKSKGFAYSYLTGGTEQREEVIEEFQNNKKNSFFLISIKAGGVGLNLTQADYVFILDPWWNPAVENQAIARAHRIGQKNKVFVYRFISNNTVEEKILRLQKEKAQLADEFVNSNNPFKTLGKEEIISLFD